MKAVLAPLHIGGWIITIFFWIIALIMVILVAMIGASIITFGGCILWILITPIIPVLYTCAKCCCCGEEFVSQCLFWKSKKLACGKCDQKLAHLFMTIVFPHLFTKHIQEAPPQNDNKDNFVAITIKGEVSDESVDLDYKDVYLIGGKEFDEEEKELLPYPKGCHGKKVACCYTYTYFIVATILGLLWFIVMTLENAIYRKTGTCHDINVLANSFTCFDITSDPFDPAPINCDIGKDPDITVFCYLYSPNPGALGIAVGIVNLLFFGVTAYFRLTTKMAEKKSFRVLVIVVQVVLYLLTIAVCIGLVVGHFTFNSGLYFFQGNPAMRWTMFLLIPITAAAMIPVPWCFFTDTPVHNTNMSINTSHRKPKSQGKTPATSLETSH